MEGEIENKTVKHSTLELPSPIEGKSRRRSRKTKSANWQRAIKVAGSHQKSLRRQGSTVSSETLSFDEDSDDGYDPLERWDLLPEHLRVKKASQHPHHRPGSSVPFTVRFGLLFCKDLKLAARRKKIIAIELLLPIICVMLLAIYVGFKSTHSIEDKYVPFNPAEISLPFIKCRTILLAPNTHIVEAVAEDLEKVLNDKANLFEVKVVDVPDVNHTKASICGAVVLWTTYDGDVGNDLFPKHITYEIRLRSLQRSLLTDENKDRPYSVVSQWATDEIYPRELTHGPREKTKNTGGRPGYYSEGFMYLQSRIDRILTQLMYMNNELLKPAATSAVLPNGNVPPYPSAIRPHYLIRFSYPEFLNTDVVHILDKNLPILLLFGLSAVFICNSWLIVDEKTRTQWFPRTFGLYDGLRWTTWILREMIVNTVAIIVLTGILCIEWHGRGTSRFGIIDHADPTLVSIFLLAVYFNTICTSALVSAFFSSAFHAATGAALVHTFYLFPFVYLEPNYELLPVWWRFYLCLFPPGGLALGCQQLALAEAHSGGYKWNAIFRGTFPLGHIILTLFLGGVIKVVLALYVRHIYVTTENQVAMTWLYPFKKWWWMGHLPPDNQKVRLRRPNENIDNFEADPRRRRREMKVSNISKCYTKEAGIFSVSINFFEGETTTILGGHWSGKSTLLAILAGLQSPTLGTVYINKHNIQKETEYGRCNTGICPQDDLLFGYLTVEEIISFFVQLQGVLDLSEAFEEATRLIRDIEMEGMRVTKVDDLSFSQRRLVHIAIAFCGGCKVVLLDEPTRNMDHATKRIAWRFIEKEKEKRCVIVLTKSSEEAYFLADRMAMLIRGEIICRGSIGFINARYGGGYHLVVTKGEKFNINELSSIVHRNIPNGSIRTDTSTEVTFYLPREDTPNFPDFFREFENAKTAIGYESYLISHFTTKEIFRLAEKQSEIAYEEEFEKTKNPKKLPKLEPEVPFQGKFPKSRNPICTYFFQFVQLILKEFRFFKRMWLWYLAPITLPMIILSLVCYSITTQPFDKNLPPLNFDTELYEKIGIQQLFLKCDRTQEPYVTDACDTIADVASQYLLNPVLLPEKVNITEKILSSYDKNTMEVTNPYLLAVEVHGHAGILNIRTHFNNQPLHSPPIAINFMSNVILQRLVTQHFNVADPNEYKISVVNFPLQYSHLHLLGLSEYLWSSGFYCGLAISWAMTFFVPIFIVMPIREKIFKHMQTMSGGNLVIFWAAKFIWEFFIFSIVCVSICLIVYSFHSDGFNTLHSIYSMGLLVMLFGICAIGIVHCLVPLFKSSGIVGYFYTWFVFLLIGPVPMSYILISVESTETPIHNFFLIFPNYALGMGVFQMYSFSRYREECPLIPKEDMEGLCATDPTHGCCLVEHRYHSFSIKGVGVHDVAISTVGVIAHIFAIFIETQLFHSMKVRLVRCLIRWKKRNKVGDGLIDETEREFVTFIDDLIKDNTDLNIQNLNCLPGKGNLLSLDLTIKRNECFCLIGADKSGCKDLLPLIAGLEIPSSGDVMIGGGSLTLGKNYKNFLRHFGLCQEFPNLMPELTGRETLKLFGTLRKISCRKLSAAVSLVASKLKLTQDLDKFVRKYSSSSLKKLAIAVAIIGEPNFILLEEPLNDVDPVGRTHMIKTLIEYKEHSCLIITARSLEGYEDICDRIAVMVNGKIRCIGSPDFMKEAFCSGYTITAKLVPDDVNFYEHEGDKDEQTSDNDNESRDFSQDSEESRPKMISSTASVPAWLKIKEAITGKSKSSSRSSSTTSIDVKRFKGDPHGLVTTEKDSVLLARRQTTLNFEPSSESIHGAEGSRGPRFSQIHIPLMSSEDMNLQSWEKELLPLMDYIEEVFPGAELVNIYSCFVHYHIPPNVRLSYVFEKLESAREDMDLESYTVGRATLEQVCINFTGGQKVEHNKIG